MRADNKVKKEYLKDMEFEKTISLLNSSLSEVQQQLFKFTEEKFPTIHIIGVPRSGTTLLTQFLASHLNVGYINNLIAAFWKAPLFGIQLSKKLLDSNFKSSYKSEFGRTQNINEPHEFGYFWNYHLKYEDFEQKELDHENKIDWQSLKTILINMAGTFNLPVLFKSFLTGFHSKKIYEVMPKSCFIYVRRDPLENAISILKLREKLSGNVKNWTSIKPKQYSWLKEEDVFTQIAGQVLFLDYEYKQQLLKIPDSNKLIVGYEESCKNPEDLLRNIHQIIKNQGIESEMKQQELPEFKIKSSLDSTENNIVQSFQSSFQKLKKDHPYL